MCSLRTIKEKKSEGKSCLYLEEHQSYQGPYLTGTLILLINLPNPLPSASPQNAVTPMVRVSTLQCGGEIMFHELHLTRSSNEHERYAQPQRRITQTPKSPETLGSCSIHSRTGCVQNNSSSHKNENTCSPGWRWWFGLSRPWVRARQMLYRVKDISLNVVPPNLPIFNYFSAMKDSYI